MPTGLTYATYKTQIATMAVVAEDDTAFLEILPLAIDYAELRIQRDLDLRLCRRHVRWHGDAQPWR